MVFAFVHLRILDVCRASILKNRSRELHRMSFEVLVSDATSKPEELAWHCDECDDHEHAVRYGRDSIVTVKRLSGDVYTFVEACLASLERLEEEGPLSDWAGLQKLTTLSDQIFHLQIVGSEETWAASAMESAQKNLEETVQQTLDKYDNLRDIENPEAKAILIKVLYAPMIRT